MSLKISNEDQKRICDFSVQVSRCELLKSEIETLKMNIAASADALKELEMVLDEDLLLPVKCGSGFVHVPYDKMQTILQDEQQKRREKLATLQSKYDHESERSVILKKVLQTKFGDSIQLEM